MPRLLSTAPLVVLLACSGQAAPPTCDNTELELPSGRGELSAEFDADRSRMILFAGNQGVPMDCGTTATDFVGETWVFHSQGCDLPFEKLVTADAPHARGRFGTALDASRQRMLLFGGRFRDGDAGAYKLYDDLWAFDFETDTWAKIAAPNGPTARVNFVMEVMGDALYVFGGNDATDGATPTYLHDTWRLDLVTKTWTDLTKAKGPEGRVWAASATDGDAMYVFGGGGGLAGPFFADVWKLAASDGKWTRLHGAANAPRERFWANLEWDAANAGLLMFGGHDNTDLGNSNDLWSYSPSKDAWTQLREGDTPNLPANGQCDFPPNFTHVDMASPERRNAAATAMDPEQGLLLFGGKTDCGLINDVWAFSVSDGAWSNLSSATVGESCLRNAASCTALCF